MKFLFHLYIKSTILIILFAGSISASDISNMDEAVNIAGRQRMLSYRIFKDYLLSEMKSNYKNPKKKLQDDIKLFEDSQAALKKYLQGKGFKTSIDNTDTEFAKEKEALSKPFDASKAKEYLSLAKSTKDAANTVVSELVSQGGTGQPKLIGKIGSLRLYSQQFATYYMLQTMGVPKKNLKNKLSKLMANSADAFKFINSAGIKNKQALNQWDKIVKIYRFFRVSEGFGDTFMPTMIIKKSNSVVEYANNMIKILNNKH